MIQENEEKLNDSEESDDKEDSEDSEDSEESDDFENKGESEEKTGPNFTSPEAVVMLMIAITLDMISIIPVANFATTIIGAIVIGLWIFSKSGKISMTKAAQKMGKKLLKRLGLTALIEAIPIISAVYPGWTVLVFLELKNG